MFRKLRSTALLQTAALVLILACNPPGASPAPTGSPGTSPQPTATPATPSPTLPPISEVPVAAQAAAIVFAHEHIARMGPREPDMIGQSSWYEAYEETGGFGVKITVGSGDCQAGCIERHTWTYHVDFDGTVTLVGDEGDDIGLPSAEGTADPVSLRVTLIADPVCPVVRDPPDPACAPRPVVNVDIFVYDAALNEVAHVVSDESGAAWVQLAPGAYVVAPAMVSDLMGQAAAQAFAAVGGDSVGLRFSYDTGIR